MTSDPTILHEIRDLVKSSYYPLIIETLREKFVNKMVATDPVTGYDQRDHWHRMIGCLAEFDKELRVIAESAKFRS
jgi:hypothetical protein